MNRYSLSSDSPRWWWSTGLAGAAGTVAVTFLLVVALAPPSPAKERGPDRSGGGSVIQPADRVGAQVPCFIQALAWDAAMDGPIPTCTSAYLTQPLNALARPRPAVDDCPALPNPQYVGVPWVAYTDECSTLREWWEHVELP